MASDVRITLRLPDDLHVRLAAHARRERRSLNADLVYLLEKTLGEDDADGSPVPAPLRGKPDSSPA